MRTRQFVTAMQAARDSAWEGTEPVADRHSLARVLPPVS